MRRALCITVGAGVLAGLTGLTSAELLSNANLDRTYAQEIVPGFFLPKPIVWVNEGFRTITGPYEDEMSMEPWAGPAPTPVTTDGNLNGPFPAGYGGPDGGAFFKAFSGNAANGPATGHLYQDVPATPGLTYEMSGWAGAEANLLVANAVMALEFLDGTQTVIPASGQTLSLLPTLFVANGEPFNYKKYTLTAQAPANAAFARVRFSMIDGQPNPLGGGQALVVDDFSLVVPEPTSALALAGALVLARRVRRA